MGQTESSHELKCNAKSTALEVIEFFAVERGLGQRYLEGKTAIVTGGNSGIGLECCKALAYAGARVILCSRSVASGEKGVETEIKKLGEGNYIVHDTSNIVVKELDLNSLKSVKSFAEDILANEERIDFLVCNAGIMALPSLEFTEDGFEKQIGVNAFGHFYLAQKLLPKMTAQDFDNRIVVLSSTAHNMGGVDVQDLHFTKGRVYKPWVSYGQSKLADLLLAKSLADKTAHTKTTACSVHPGVIRTALWRSAGVLGDVITFFITDKTVPQGAATSIWACLSPTVIAENRGAYLMDCAPSQPTVAAGVDADGKRREALWKVMEEQVNAAAAKL